jgi:hypothetical protein
VTHAELSPIFILSNQRDCASIIIGTCIRQNR